MLYFENDYSEGAHPKVLEALIKTNFESLSGYGSDSYCKKAKNKIKEVCKCDDADVYFLVGGTQTNQIIIDTMLEAYEGVVAVETGHVSVHEAGAIEYSGHKVLTVPTHDGKMDVEELKDLIETFYNDANHEHMVFPGMVYISHPTEYGTLYTKEELMKISEICKQHEIRLFLDGARLGYGVMAQNTDVDIPTIAKYCDVFYIGGTKIGALCGEAVVFTKNNTPKHFITRVKQHGALLAKGRLLGIQFDTLFTDNLYFKISKNAIDTSEVLKKGLKERGYKFYLDSPTNQQFIVIENDKMDKLSEKVRFSFWEKYDKEHTVIRFATSWSTKMEDVEALIKLL